MEHPSSEHVDGSLLAMREALSGDPDALEYVDRWAEELRARFNAETVGFCFSKYIGSELDFRTPGDRGVGRIFTHIPRLGAYFMKQLSKLSPEELLYLYRIIQDLMLRGYLTRALLLEAPPKQPKLTTGPELYDIWLPGFYTSDPSQMGPHLRQILAQVTDSAFAELTAFFGRHAMRGGGLFRKDKTELICMYYPLGGFAVRVFEVGDIR